MGQINDGVAYPPTPPSDTSWLIGSHNGSGGETRNFQQSDLRAFYSLLVGKSTYADAEISLQDPGAIVVDADARSFASVTLDADCTDFTIANGGAAAASQVLVVHFRATGVDRIVTWGAGIASERADIRVVVDSHIVVVFTRLGTSGDWAAGILGNVPTLPNTWTALQTFAGASVQFQNNGQIAILDGSWFKCVNFEAYTLPSSPANHTVTAADLGLLTKVPPGVTTITPNDAVGNENQWWMFRNITGSDVIIAGTDGDVVEPLVRANLALSPKGLVTGIKTDGEFVMYGNLKNI